MIQKKMNEMSEKFVSSWKCGFTLNVTWSSNSRAAITPIQDCWIDHEDKMQVQISFWDHQEWTLWPSGVAQWHNYRQLETTAAAVKPSTVSGDKRDRLDKGNNFSWESKLGRSFSVLQVPVIFRKLTFAI